MDTYLHCSKKNKNKKLARSLPLPSTVCITVYVLCLNVIILLLLGNGMNQFCSELMHLVIADYFMELSGEQPKVD